MRGSEGYYGQKSDAGLTTTQWSSVRCDSSSGLLDSACDLPSSFSRKLLNLFTPDFNGNIRPLTWSDLSLLLTVVMLMT